MADGRLLALLAAFPLAACVTSPDGLRLEDRPDENLVRIVNTQGRAAHFYSTRSRGWDSPYEMFHVRYRDRDGRLVDLDGGPGEWFTPLIASSDLYPLGRVPSRRFTINAGTSLDFPRNEVFEWLGAFTHVRPPIAGPCTAQLRLYVRWHPRETGRHEVLGDWAPAPCPPHVYSAPASAPSPP